jgi:peptide/nickel transport system ATP-binding protein
VDNSPNSPSLAQQVSHNRPPSPSLLDVRGLTKEYASGRGWFSRKPAVRAVDEVSFSVASGETFGLVGESGCGKTTTGRCILRLIEPTSGQIRFQDRDLLALSSREMRQARRHLQIVFQDPYSSLNPRMRAGAIVAEPLIIHRIGTRASRDTRVRELFELVGLDPTDARKYPHEFSGGQRQRIGLARAIALEPSLVICDEPVSALDVSVQAQVVNLLLDLQQRLGLTYLFIAHDLRLVRQICDRVAVMYRGRLVEVAAAERIFSRPVHPYTKALLSAIPHLKPGEKLERIPFDGSTFERVPLREVETGHFAAI